MCTSSTSNRGKRSARESKSPPDINIVELLLLNWLSFVSPGRHPTWLQETDRNQRLDDYASAAAAAAEEVHDFEPFRRNLAFHHLSEDIAEEEDNDDNDNYDVVAFDELGRAGPAQSLEPTETFSRSDRSLLPVRGKIAYRAPRTRILTFPLNYNNFHVAGVSRFVRVSDAQSGLEERSELRVPAVSLSRGLLQKLHPRERRAAEARLCGLQTGTPLIVRSGLCISLLSIT
ncbi:unnamed protein product [Trichogramma brassicae]|uniref:Uncharacterized protein n=1 Tax=Trichogramma brassicae TaxID=86971 RepID=A0A6H5I3T4_9HYME|nr:unnamed protein product [Trichogramma brassicae]